MFCISLDDPMLEENVEAMLSLRKMGFPGKEIEKLYERQLELDQEELKKTGIIRDKADE